MTSAATPAFQQSPSATRQPANRAGRSAGTDAACGVAATLPRSAYYDALQLNYYVREAFATGWLLLRGN